MHITGSDATHDAIVWQGQPKQGVPPYTKPVTSELGCVSPVVVVPGVWSAADLDQKALDVVAGACVRHACMRSRRELMYDRGQPFAFHSRRHSLRRLSREFLRLSDFPPALRSPRARRTLHSPHRAHGAHAGRCSGDAQRILQLPGGQAGGGGQGLEAARAVHGARGASPAGV